MNRSDFYNDRRKERKIDFLGDYRVVRRYFCRKHDLSAGEFEFICKLHALGTFIKQDFEQGRHVISWDPNTWFKLQKDWIKVYRERQPSRDRNYRIYSLNYKGKKMIEDCYKILCGEIPIPEDVKKNPIMKEETYNDKRFAKAIKAFNAARQEKQ